MRSSSGSDTEWSYNIHPWNLDWKQCALLQTGCQATPGGNSAKTGVFAWENTLLVTSHMISEGQANIDPVLLCRSIAGATFPQPQSMMHCPPPLFFFVLPFAFNFNHRDS